MNKIWMTTTISVVFLMSSFLLTLASQVSLSHSLFKTSELFCLWYFEFPPLLPEIFTLRVFRYLAPFYLSGLTWDADLDKRSLLHSCIQPLPPPLFLILYLKFMCFHKLSTIYSHFSWLEDILSCDEKNYYDTFLK